MSRASPASICVVSVASLDRNVAFYRDVMGLDASPVETLAGAAFTRHWHLPAGSTARAALLRHPASEVGRILLVEFDRPGENVRGPELTRQFRHSSGIAGCHGADSKRSRHRPGERP